MKFNTAIAAMMSFLNEIYDVGELTVDDLMAFIRILCPFAPHIAEEIWEKFGMKGYCSLAAWPEYDESKLVESTMEIAVQISGKFKATVSVPSDTDKDSVIAAAKANEKISSIIEGRTIVKEIYVENKLVNIVVR